MLAKHLEILEFPKILQLLARHTSFSASTALAEALAPSTDESQIHLAQDATEEARHLLQIRPGLPVRGAHDVRPQAHHAALGGSLQPADLVRVAATVGAGRAMRNLLTRPELGLSTLAAYARRTPNLDPLEALIRRAVDEDGRVLDTASDRLRVIRTELKVAHDRLTRRLNDLITGPSLRDALQEPIVTMRAGRYVIPVKADFRGRVPGIVHDQSASGATVFIEPLSVVDLANQWRQRGIEEEHEIERILRELSGRIGSVAEALVETVDALAEIDLALARGKLAEDMGAARPLLHPVPGEADDSVALRLLQARHPLLQGEAVPIDVELGRSFDVLLISGPNTGGKTVALKTVGLLALMAQAGLQIPAASGSELSIFSGVYADIGDEQSIEQSLSTFSSHIGRIIEILAVADLWSLVLLDEIGAGTDPQEGSALGRALLGHLAAQHILTVATTHHSDLKLFASSTSRVQNASVEFDAETLRPTYRLIIGLPGQSNALSIAARLGMDASLVADARRWLEPHEQRADELLAEIHRQLAQARADRTEAGALRQEADRAARQLQARLADLEAEREAMLVETEEQAAAMIAEVEAELDALRRELRGLRTEQARLAELEQRLAGARQASAAHKPPAAASTSPYRVGDTVAVPSLGLTGTLWALSADQQTAEVHAGTLKVRVPVTDLRPGDPRAAVEKASGFGIGSRPGPAVRQARPELVEGQAQPERFSSWAPIDAQLDLRGSTGEEARQRLDQYLSDAYMGGVKTVRVVHGKGAGILREAVRALVAEHPLVQSYRTAAPRDGGEGATIVELAV